MVKFADLKVGDKIARRKMELVEGKLEVRHLQAHTVQGLSNVYTRRSVMVVSPQGDEYVMSDLQFSTIDDELKTWDRV